jgi:hypothetical protein
MISGFGFNLKTGSISGFRYAYLYLQLEIPGKCTGIKFSPFYLSDVLGTWLMMGIMAGPFSAWKWRW